MSASSLENTLLIESGVRMRFSGLAAMALLLYPIAQNAYCDTIYTVEYLRPTVLSWKADSLTPALQPSGRVIKSVKGFSLHGADLQEEHYDSAGHLVQARSMT